MKRQPVLIIRQVLLLTNLEEIIPPMNVSCPNGEGESIWSREQTSTQNHLSPSSQNLRFYRSRSSLFLFFLAPLYTITPAVSSLTGGGAAASLMQQQCNVDLHSRRHPARWQTKKAQRKQDFVGNQSIQKWCPSSTAFILYRQWLIHSNFKRSLVRAPTKKANDKTVEYPFKVASHHCIHH